MYFKTKCSLSFNPSVTRNPAFRQPKMVVLKARRARLTLNKPSRFLIGLSSAQLQVSMRLQVSLRAR